MKKLLTCVLLLMLFVSNAFSIPAVDGVVTAVSDASINAVSDRVIINTALNFSKLGGVKSDSIPRISVGDTWNMEFSLDITSKASIGSFLNGVGNFVSREEVLILACIETDFSSEEFMPIITKNLVGNYIDDLSSEDSKKRYFYAISPKQKNQQITFQLRPSELGNHSLTITYYYIDSADKTFYSSKNISELFGIEQTKIGEAMEWLNTKSDSGKIVSWLNSKTADKLTKQRYNMVILNNSSVDYKFRIE